MRKILRLPHGAAPGRTAESGFTLVEVVVAMFIFTMTAITLGSVLAGGLKGVILSRQRATATADANQILETSRSLSYADVGLVSSDNSLSTDTAISGTCPASCTYNGEKLVFAQNAANHPFNPHIQNNISRPPTTLNRNIYVTEVDTNGDGTGDVKKVTVVVSWLRSPNGAVASSVTASTVISANSPGTPGNPPYGTPSGSSPPVSSYPPISGQTYSSIADATLEAALGLGVNLDNAGAGIKASIANVWGVNGKGSNDLSSKSTVACYQQAARVEGGSNPTSGQSVSTSNDSVLNPGPSATAKTTTDSPVGAAPAPITVTDPLLLGYISCNSSAVIDASHLPYENGSSTLSSLTASVNTASASPALATLLGVVNLLEVSGANATQSANQSNFANKQLDTMAKHGLASMKVLRQVISTGVTDIGASNGIVWVDAYESTATATAPGSGPGSYNINYTPGKELRIKLWDAGSSSNLHDQNGNPITCNSREGNYCVIQPGPHTQLIAEMDREFCLPNITLPVGSLACLSTIRVQFTVTVNPPAGTTTVLGGGPTTVYRMNYQPLVVIARISGRNGTSTDNVFDLRTTASLGRILACSKFGNYAGGCS